METITFVLPSRNNLEFLKHAYGSIRNLKHTHEILVLNDASIDGTGEWIEEQQKNDDNLIVYTNNGPDRIGIVGMFDKGIEMATTDIIFAFHADMVASPNLDTNILKHLKEKTVVCATRVEPPIHPEGPEKIIMDLGVESDQLVLENAIEALGKLENQNKDKKTEGVFAPWCMYKKDFMAIGGHDDLLAPQSREDSDLFNRFLLNGYNLIQSWDALVYHFTCRGSRFNKFSGGDTGKNSEEWQQTNLKNSRNFIRKWGHMVKHDALMKPIIPHKYDIAFRVDTNGLTDDVAFQVLGALEPWCSLIGITNENAVNKYLEIEQENTKFDLKERVMVATNKMGGDQCKLVGRDVYIEFSATEFLQSQQANFQFIQQLPEILAESGEVGEMEYGCFKITINDLTTYETELIVCENTGWRRKNHK
jgi:glycosyltransferase involved in cell wall biosynthesis